MARITVEQVALTDTRYVHLGSLYKKDRLWALGLMIFIWNQCQELEKYSLTFDEISFIHERIKNLPANLITAGLATLNDDGSLYIRGTKGRIEWLQERRKDGKKGGRPHNPTVNPTVLRQNNPPAPAPAPVPVPAPVQKKKEHTPRQAGLAYSPAFLKFYSIYPGPRKHGRVKPFQAWGKALKLHGLTEESLVEQCSNALVWQIKSEDWTKENGQFIPAPEVYLNQARWEQEPYDPKEAAKMAARLKDQQILAELKEKGVL